MAALFIILNVVGGSANFWQWTQTHDPFNATVAAFCWLASVVIALLTD